ncbi:MAG: ATP-binding protein [Burkholderiales bacterium]|nr:ATP-binding protein [Phycisphaerae bacterium]
MQDYEKLGVFYLGREYDLQARTVRDDLVLYDSKDLVTHGVCVGMTGSGKTGLCIGLLEEAAIDGIPSIVIDPKGDLSNLLLTFPQLRPEDFKPWVNPDDARKAGVEVDQYAAQQAELWKTGLAKWDEDGARIQRLRDAAEFAIYTPGSNAGIPLSILHSFDDPGEAITHDPEDFQQRIATTVSSLLGLLELDSDPLSSPHHIFLSNLFSHAWFNDQDTSLTLESLVTLVQSPPFSKLGVMDLDSVYSADQRFKLAMKINSLLASPSFKLWTQGDPLDIQSLLYTPAGKPRVAVISIAHLGDSERMFFVSLLLNQMLGWMRTQKGTTSLRALLYMDEIFGYFPPVANPPSKLPLLTLLKQGRAFGLGVLLATQNPVDLDYKGLANCGTWFIGRLQTERDKQRVLEGLEGAAAGASQKFDRSRMEQTLAGLGNRVFLMNNVHEDEPVTFQTRWTLSYLRGPLGRAEIKQLMAGMKAPAATVATTTEQNPSTPQRPVSKPAAAKNAGQPVLPPTVKQYFIPVRSAAPAGATLVYEPYLLGTADVYFLDKKNGVDESRQVALLADITDGPVPVEWSGAAECQIPEADLDDRPAPGATFAALPTAASQAKNYAAWTSAFADGVYRVNKLEVMVSDDADMVSKPGESERDFRARLAQVFREQRDAVTEKLRARYAPKLTTLQERLRKAEQKKQKEQAEASTSKWTAALSVGASLLGALLGRKRISSTNAGRVATASRQVGQTMKQSGDVDRAEEDVATITQRLADLQLEFEQEVAAATSKCDAATVELTRLIVRPKKTDIKTRLVALAWVPQWQDATGTLRPAWG